jgi:hypothetical protein
LRAKRNFLARPLRRCKYRFVKWEKSKIKMAPQEDKYGEKVASLKGRMEAETRAREVAERAAEEARLEVEAVRLEQEGRRGVGDMISDQSKLLYAEVRFS